MTTEQILAYMDSLPCEELIIRANRGMRDWFDRQLEKDPDNDFLKSGKMLCTDNIDMIEMQQKMIKHLKKKLKKKK